MNDADIIHLLKQRLVGKQIGKIIYSKSPSTNYNSNFNFSDFEKDWVFSIDGLTIYQEPFSNLINKLRTIIDKIRVFNDFKEFTFPRIITRSTVDKFNLIKQWPYYLITVKGFNTRKYHHKITRLNEYFLDPVQCTMFYEYLSKIEISKTSLPIKIKEFMGGWSFRNEDYEKITSVIKDLMFLRYEFVFAGLKESILKLRSETINSLTILFDALDMPFRIVIGDGCYEFPTSEYLFALNTCKTIVELPVIDLQVYSPILDNWIEIAGASYFRDKKIKRYNIRFQKLESGCLGIGMSRFAILFLMNNGLERNNWPTYINEN